MRKSPKKPTPEPVKSKRVSARANKGNREEDEDFETAPSFDKVEIHENTNQSVSGLECVISNN